MRCSLSRGWSDCSGYPCKGHTCLWLNQRRRMVRGRMGENWHTSPYMYLKLTVLLQTRGLHWSSVYWECASPSISMSAPFRSPNLTPFHEVSGILTLQATHFDPSPPLKHWGNVHRHKTWRSSGNLTNLTYNKGWEVSKHSLKGRNRDWYPQRLHWQLQLVPVSRGGPATRRDALQRKQRAPWKVPLAWPKGFTKIYLFYWICPPL